MSQVTTKWILKLVDRVSGPGKKAQQRAGGIGNAFKKAGAVGNKALKILGVGTLSLTSILAGASAQTAVFQNEFLELKNLNLDKSVEQVDALRKSVLRTALDTGLAAQATSKSYFDIQSATGLYGEEVDGIVTKIGKFSIATKAQLDSVTNATGKAIGIWKFGNDQMDNYLASMAKTVQVGVTTFDQLARVQVDYAGAAAAAGQGFDSANKLFAAFTKSAKSTEEAATATKTAFMGLSDPNVQKGLASYGIKLFDTAGNMRSIDEIATDLVGTLSTMNDQQFSKFMGKVGGPEGLKILLNQAKANGDGLLQTFKDFDNVQFDVGEAIKNANGDVTILANLLKNRVNTLLIAIGQVALPSIIRGFETMNGWVVGLFNFFETKGQIVVDVLKSIAIGVGITSAAYGVWWLVTNLMTLSMGSLSKAQLALNAAMKANVIGIVVTAISALVTGLALAWQRSEKFRGILVGLVEAAKWFGVALKDNVLNTIKNIISGVSGIGNALGLLFKGKFGAAREAAGEAFNTLKTASVGNKSIGAATREGFDTGYTKGFSAVMDRKGTSTFKNPIGQQNTPDTKGKSIQDLFKDDEKPITDDLNTSGSSPSGKSGLSANGGTGSGKSITMNLDITNIFQLAEDAIDKAEEIAEKVMEKVNDKLKDGVIQYAN